MPPVGHFLDILDAISRKDWAVISEIIQDLAKKEKKKKHFHVAHQLLEALDAIHSTNESELITIKSSEFCNNKPDILEEIPLDNSQDPALNSGLKHEFDDFLKEWHLIDILRNQNLEPRKSILMYGPPGCGKTLSAKYISKKLNKKLYLVKFDSLISSYLGETGANIRKIFEFIKYNNCILLLDEIDAIGKMRDDKNELGELKRVVITLLQNLDMNRSDSLIIGCTNHPDLLDPALWRRFEIVWHLPMISSEERKKIIKDILKENMHKLNNFNSFISCTKKFSGDETVNIVNNALRKYYIENNMTLEECLFVSTIEKIRKQIQNNKLNENLILASYELWKECKNKYSIRQLQKITGIPHSTLHNRYKQLEVYNDN